MSLADGEYRIEVSLGGGSGKATVESPAALSVTDGKMQAEIQWSSPNYDYMEVDGKGYTPVNEGGNSRFVIDVEELDMEIPVQAETVAMSQPHMIDYTLYFDSSTIHKQGDFYGPMIGFGVGIIAIAAAAAVCLRRKKHEKK